MCTYFDENFLNLVPAEQVEGLYGCLDYYRDVDDPFSIELLNRYEGLLPGERDVHRRERVHRARTGRSSSGRRRSTRPARSNQDDVIAALDHARIAQGPGGPAEMVPGQHHVRMNMYIARSRGRHVQGGEEPRPHRPEGVRGRRRRRTSRRHRRPAADASASGLQRAVDPRREGVRPWISWQRSSTRSTSLRRVVGALDDSQMDVVTNCEPWTVRRLASHALNNQLLWAGLVTGEQTVSPEDTMGAVAYDGDLAAVRRRGRPTAALAMWRTDGVLDADARHPVRRAARLGRDQLRHHRRRWPTRGTSRRASVAPIEFDAEEIPAISAVVAATCTDAAREHGLIKPRRRRSRPMPPRPSG